MVVGWVLIATGAESEYQRVGIFNNYAGDKASELCFLFKSPTCPRSEADISAKIEIETRFERLAMATKYSGDSSSGSSMLLDSANINLFGNTETSSRGWGEGELMVENPQGEKVLSSEIQPEDHGMTNDTRYNFEDEEAWIEGVSKII
ncbi:hypothetical protein OIDMADRAFT_52881 [Oidiodendron maius Zn]|uniref:Uncharacterized protein n=1 Tax=Oidiodendron maius (strain Zn) TaxID=913774 RepID=A0A0C3DM16_OIDMZ|nr:hypothetical protein OIDMADRAFT_52881 [Oidiodendron maius Zn]